VLVVVLVAVLIGEPDFRADDRLPRRISLTPQVQPARRADEQAKTGERRTSSKRLSGSPPVSVSDRLRST
jgi:hypothetical protein